MKIHYVLAAWINKTIGFNVILYSILYTNIKNPNRWTINQLFLRTVDSTKWCLFSIFLGLIFQNIHLVFGCKHFLYIYKYIPTIDNLLCLLCILKSIKNNYTFNRKNLCFRLFIETRLGTKSHFILNSTLVKTTYSWRYWDW